MIHPKCDPRVSDTPPGRVGDVKQFKIRVDTIEVEASVGNVSIGRRSLFMNCKMVPKEIILFDGSEGRRIKDYIKVIEEQLG